MGAEGTGARKERKLRKAFEANPAGAEACLDLGKYYFLKEEFARAGEVYRQGLEHNPDSVGILLNLAVTREAQGRCEDAKKLNLKVLEVDANNQSAQ
ncbi:MAG TPA: hypothetical protein PLI51_09295, partial [bacterium]|nr:hypothetical protein [bacterium]